MEPKLFNPTCKPIPRDSIPCYYVNEWEKTAAATNSRNFHPDVTTSNYFLIREQPTANILRGHLGRTDREAPFLEDFDRGLEYFIDFLDRRDIYFTFNKVELYKGVQIIPGQYLMFTLEKINLKQMEQEQAKIHTQHITVNAGDGNIITTGNNNTITSPITLAKGDMESLRNTLKKYGVPQDDINEISAIVSEELPDRAGNFGPKTDGWLRKMYRKAADGGWEVSIATAGGLLVEALKTFFGS